MWLEPNFRRGPETEIFGLAQLQRQMWVNLNWNSERNVVSVFTGNGKISVWFRSTVNVNFKIKHFPAFTCKTFISWGSQDIYTGNSKELQPRVWNCILQDFSWNSNDWKIVINNKATHDEVFFSPLPKKLHCSTALITCWTSSSSVWIKLFVRQKAKKFHPISASSFVFPFRKC